MNIDRILVDVYLFSVLTSQQTGKNGGEHRRYTLVDQPQLQDPELQKLINREFLLANSCEKLNLERQKMENENNELLELLNEINNSIHKLGENDSTRTKPPRLNKNAIILEYNNFVKRYREIISNQSVETDFETTINRLFNLPAELSDRNKKIVDGIIGQYKILRTFIHDIVYLNLDKKIKTDRRELETCRNKIELIKLEICTQQVRTINDLSHSSPQPKQTSEKGGIRKGGRRTRRSIKVITKRKIKVKSKTIKKKSRRKNKTRRQ